MRKVVINKCYGGFGLSDKATNEYERLSRKKDIYSRDIPRDDLILIGIVEDLKKEANGRFAKLKIVEIPADVEWQIEEYDGIEWIAEKHRTWN